MMTLETALLQELSKITDLLKSELSAQGHRNTGSLERSFTQEVRREGGLLVGTIKANDYAIYLEFGVPANRIPFSPGSGAKSSKYIAGLINYFTTKGLASNDARSAAFATAYAHKREGMPTRASFAYSSNGRRTGFMRTTLTQYLPTLVSNLQTAGAQDVNVQIAGNAFALNLQII